MKGGSSTNSSCWTWARSECSSWSARWSTALAKGAESACTRSEWRTAGTEWACRRQTCWRVCTTSAGWPPSSPTRWCSSGPSGESTDSSSSCWSDSFSIPTSTPLSKYSWSASTSPESPRSSLSSSPEISTMDRARPAYTSSTTSTNCYPAPPPPFLNTSSIITILSPIPMSKSLILDTNKSSSIIKCLFKHSYNKYPTLYY